MKVIHLILLTTATCLFCTPIAAQRGKGRGAKIFAKLDKNEDGKISKAEAKDSRLAQRFDKIDKNEDGFLTKAELKGAAKGRKGKGRKGKGHGKGRRGKGKKGQGGGNA